MSGGLMEAARASWWHSSFLLAAGAKIGRGVYFDTMSFSVGLQSPASAHLLNSWPTVMLRSSQQRCVFARSSAQHGFAVTLHTTPLLPGSILLTPKCCMLKNHAQRFTALLLRLSCMQCRVLGVC